MERKVDEVSLCLGGHCRIQDTQDEIQRRELNSKLACHHDQPIHLANSTRSINGVDLQLIYLILEMS